MKKLNEYISRENNLQFFEFTLSKIDRLVISELYCCLKIENSIGDKVRYRTPYCSVNNHQQTLIARGQTFNIAALEYSSLLDADGCK